MSQMLNVERQIKRVEGFDVRVLWPSQKDVRSDKQGLPSYPFERAARNELTVYIWKQQRFLSTYPGYDVEVLNAAGQSVPGNTKLSTVRATY